jgi:hypothetical protein
MQVEQRAALDRQLKAEHVTAVIQRLVEATRTQDFAHAVDKSNAREKQRVDALSLGPEVIAVLLQYRAAVHYRKFGRGLAPRIQGSRCSRNSCISRPVILFQFAPTGFKIHELTHNPAAAVDQSHVGRNVASIEVVDEHDLNY